MTRWAAQVINVPNGTMHGDVMNKMGEQGWEPFAVRSIVANGQTVSADLYFRRPSTVDDPSNREVR